MNKQLLLALVLLLLLVACLPAADSPDQFEPLQDKQRSALTHDDLMAASYPGDEPVDNAYLAPTAAALPAEHTLEGSLTIPEFEMAYQAHDGDLPRSSHAYFPEVTVDFFTYKDHLAPAVRGIVRGEGETSYWNVIFSPGRIWSEAGDEGLSRASFPFLLVGDDYGEAHNGLATFLFDDQEVSSLYLQITQETAPWHHTDFWGQAPIEYEPRPLKCHENLVEAFAGEVEKQNPIRPWSELVTGRDVEVMDAFGSTSEPVDVSASGIVKDGAIYLRGCDTRYGPFPYCGHMRHGVFSVTKSMAASVAMLRLAQKYGPQIFDLKLADYVDIQADHDGWDDVTFGDALNMATGVGDHQPRPVEPNPIHGNEDQQKFSNFMRVGSAESKLAVAFDYGNYPWGPGEIARYSSVNTFLLSAAMDAFLKEQEGPKADIWDMVVEEVYQPIGLQHAPIMRTIEPDGGKGVPIFGYGLYPTVDDVAKITTLLQNGGRHEGQQLLHPGKLAEALYQTETIGFPAGQRNAAGELRYNASYWGLPYGSQDGDAFLVPYMMGFGGNLVVLNPNGLTAFRFSDAHNYDVASKVRTAAGIEPFPTLTE
ncbi:MAG: serine hydrolase [Chloroflexota bacterium]|nr:MAG: serine hydrolase [Chloroflexota bacterium]